MKIAAITDDDETISAHSGRARRYAVYKVESSQTVGREIRPKTGHHEFATSEHKHEHRGRQDPRGHGFGKGSSKRHASMIDRIADCNVLLARGMG